MTPNDFYRNPAFKELLIKELKCVGQMLIDNSEEIIGKYRYTEDLDISIHMRTDRFEIPKITIKKEYYEPSICDEVEKAYNQYLENIRGQNR